MRILIKYFQFGGLMENLILHKKKVPIFSNEESLAQLLRGTYSWLFVPLIYSNLDDINVLFPKNFVEAFQEAITQMPPGIAHPRDFLSYRFDIRKKLKERGIHTRNDILSRRINVTYTERDAMAGIKIDQRDCYREDSFWHLTAYQQEHFLHGIETTGSGYYDFFKILCKCILQKCQGGEFIFTPRFPC